MLFGFLAYYVLLLYLINSNMRIAARAPLWLILGSTSFTWIESAADQIDYALFRDYTYYIGNYTNPLVDQPLYYNDAANALADLDAFQSLYIQYHSCAYVEGNVAQ
jgi:hypothetical protein